MVTLGFPFETVFPEQSRIELMASVLTFFDVGEDLTVPSWMIH